MHGESPDLETVVTPGSIMKAALVDAQGSPVQMPPSILHAKQGSYSSFGSGDLRIREIVVKKDQTSKTASISSASQPTGRGSVQSEEKSSARHTPAGSQSTGKPLVQSEVKPSTRPVVTQSPPKQDDGLSQAATPRPNDDRNMDGKDFPAVPIKREQTGAYKLWSAGLGPGPPPSATRALQHTTTSSRATIDMLYGDSEKDAGTEAKLAPERAPQHKTSRSQTSIAERAEQAGQSRNDMQAAAKSMLQRARELTAQTRAASKANKLNLDKPMPNLPTNTGNFQDHLREVREAERSEKNQRPALRPFPQSSNKSSKANDGPTAARTPPLNGGALPNTGRSPPKRSRNGPSPDIAEQQPVSQINSPSASQTSLVSERTLPVTREQSENRTGMTASTAPTRTTRPAIESAGQTSLVSHTKTSLTREQSETRPSASTSTAPAKTAYPPAEAQVKPASSLSKPQTTATRDARSPTPDMSSRPQSPPMMNAQAKPSNKVLPISFLRGSTLMRSSTPDSALGPNKAGDGGAEEVDPIQVLQEISKQVDASHARYTQLRIDRLKLSTAISASLKDQKPGPDYANSLLDQHLSLNALSSSMDICFAKLKALDCRKEDAIAALIARTMPLSPIDEPHVDEPSEEEVQVPAPLKPAPVAALAVQSGRSTPDIEPKTLNSTLYQAMRPSPSIGGSGSSGRPTPDLNKDISTFPSPKKPSVDTKRATEKRVTMIRDSPEPPADSDRTEALSPVSPISIEDDSKTKRIRVKGAKAAKLLGLVAESANGQTGSPDITLPDSSSPEGTEPKDQPAIEVELQSKFSDVKMTPPAPSSNKAQVPKRKPVASPRQGTNDSVGSITASSVSESAPEEPELKTPRHSQDAPFGLRSAKRGMLQTIQVFVDDDILDYYRNGADK